MLKVIFPFNIKFILIAPVVAFIVPPNILSVDVPDKEPGKVIVPVLLILKLPFIVLLVLLFKVPDMFISDNNVIVILPPVPQVKLFQVIPLVFKVVEAAIANVLPLVVTVPAVYVKVFVSYLTVPETVIVPLVNAKLFLKTPVLEFDHVPPVNDIFVVPDVVAEVVEVKLPLLVNVLLFIVVAVVPDKFTCPEIAQLSPKVKVLEVP